MKKLLLLALLLCWPAHARADAVGQWNDTALRAAFAAGLDNSAGCVDPLHESRMMAMMHVAVHDALNAIAGGPDRTPSMRTRPPERRQRPLSRPRTAACSSRSFPSSPLKSSRLPTPPLRSSKRRTRWRLRPSLRVRARPRGSCSVNQLPQPSSTCGAAMGRTRRSWTLGTPPGRIPGTSSSFPGCPSPPRLDGEM